MLHNAGTKVAHIVNQPIFQVDNIFHGLAISIGDNESSAQRTTLPCLIPSLSDVVFSLRRTSSLQSSLQAYLMAAFTLALLLLLICQVFLSLNNSRSGVRCTQYFQQSVLFLKLPKRLPSETEEFLFSAFLHMMWAGIAQSVQRLPTDWTVRGSNSCVGEVFRTLPHLPWGPPSLLYNGYRVFPGSKAAWLRR